jgi:hypothetical protein
MARKRIAYMSTEISIFNRASFRQNLLPHGFQGYVGQHYREVRSVESFIGQPQLIRSTLN